MLTSSLALATCLQYVCPALVNALITRMETEILLMPKWQQVNPLANQVNVHTRVVTVS